MNKENKGTIIILAFAMIFVLFIAYPYILTAFAEPQIILDHNDKLDSVLEFLESNIVKLEKKN